MAHQLIESGRPTLAEVRIASLDAPERGARSVSGELVLHSHRDGDRDPEPISEEGLMATVLRAGSYAHTALPWPIGATLRLRGHPDTECAIFISADLSDARVVFPDGSGIICTLG